MGDAATVICCYLQCLVVSRDGVFRSYRRLLGTMEFMVVWFKNEVKSPSHDRCFI